MFRGSLSRKYLAPWGALTCLGLICWCMAQSAQPVGADDKNKSDTGKPTEMKKSESPKSTDKMKDDKPNPKSSDKPDGQKEPPKSTPPVKEPPSLGDSSNLSDEKIIEFINQRIEIAWKENNIKPSNLASEPEFVRRLYLDVIGRIPTIEEIQAHNKGAATPIQRKAKTLQRLLLDQDYAMHWANVWTVWLLTRTSPPGIDRENLHTWLADGFANNKRYDEMVMDLLTATGKADDREAKNAAAVNFILSHVGEAVPRDPQGRDFGQFEMVPITSRVTKLFLGMQTQCTQCHDHPSLDDRKQSMYWGINVFFRQVERVPPVIQMRQRDQPLRFYELRENSRRNPDGAVFYERRNGVILKSGGVYLDGTRVSLKGVKSRREELAKLLIQDEYFAKAIVNRMWAYFMGRGFTNPVDDFSVNNPISHPELLDRLAKDFVTSGYDYRRLITWIVSSKPYQLSSETNATNAKSDTDAYFARMQLKAMSPEQLVDSIMQATRIESTRSSNEAKRRLQAEWLRDFIVNFGDDEGNEATFNGTVVQALLLMNGGKLNEALSNKPGSMINRLMTVPVEKRIDYIYLSTLSRLPTSSERAFIARRWMIAGNDHTAPMQDLMWALINSNEFILNH